MASSSSSASCPRVRLSELTPEAFHDAYVRTRTACIIEDGIQLLGPALASTRWSPETLRDACGDVNVEVEVRLSDKEKFGQTNVADRQTMPLSRFVQLLPTQKYYLTTQKLAEDDDGGQVELGGAVAMQLLRRMPWVRPALFGNLVPSQYNAWCGHAKAASRTPLHHDFHDNLYVLLSGQKEFHIFPLKKKIATGGKQYRFPNGLISYVQGLREDGAPQECVTAWKQSRIEATIAHIEASIKKSNVAADRKKLQNSLGKAEAELEVILDDTLAHQLSRNKLRHVPDGPLHFAQKSASEIGNPIVVKMNPGDALYLPASTFHEVHSTSGGDAFHFALNMWFHPPQANAPFKQPYEDDFWLHRFQQILKNSGLSADPSAFGGACQDATVPVTHTNALNSQKQEHEEDKEKVGDDVNDCERARKRARVCTDAH